MRFTDDDNNNEFTLLNQISISVFYFSIELPIINSHDFATAQRRQIDVFYFALYFTLVYFFFALANNFSLSFFRTQNHFTSFFHSSSKCWREEWKKSDLSISKVFFHSIFNEISLVQGTMTIKLLHFICQ